MKRFRNNSQRTWWIALLCCGALGLVSSRRIHGQGIEPNGNSVPGVTQAVREIDDLAGDTRWLLVQNSLLPGGPGRLVAIRKVYNAKLGAKVGAKDATVESPLPVIVRGGERVIVEQQTKKLEARFDAVALGPARCGDEFDVRLRIDGKKVRALAVAPGRVMLRSLGEERP
jgi:hypothetical protein